MIDIAPEANQHALDRMGRIIGGCSLARPAPGSRPAPGGCARTGSACSATASGCARAARGPCSRARIGQQAAQLDHLPGERIPVPPGLLRLGRQHAAHHLRHVGENLRHAARHVVVAQDVPLREPAHDRRAQRIDHPADPGLANAIGAHRARLDVGIERVVAQLLAADRLLGLRERDDLGVARHVAVADRVVDRLRQDLSVAGDHRAERVFGLAHRDARQLDATRHHRLVIFFFAQRIHGGGAAFVACNQPRASGGWSDFRDVGELQTGNIIPFCNSQHKNSRASLPSFANDARGRGRRQGRGAARIPFAAPG